MLVVFLKKGHEAFSRSSETIPACCGAASMHWKDQPWVGQLRSHCLNENQRAAWALMPAAASGKEEILSSSGCTSGSYSQGWKSSSLESEGKISHPTPPSPRVGKTLRNVLQFVVVDLKKKWNAMMGEMACRSGNKSTFHLSSFSLSSLPDARKDPQMVVTLECKSVTRETTNLPQSLWRQPFICLASEDSWHQHGCFLQRNLNSQGGGLRIVLEHFSHFEGSH